MHTTHIATPEPALSAVPQVIRPAPARERREPRRALWAQWVVANVAGEVVGFGAAGAVMAGAAGAITGATGLAQLARMAAAVALIGCLEGSAVGLAQWLVLRRALPGLGRRMWLVATIAGGTLAWAAGMAAGTTAVGQSHLSH